MVKASGMARGRVRRTAYGVRRTAYGVRRTSPQMTFLHEVIFAQRDLACYSRVAKCKKVA